MRSSQVIIVIFALIAGFAGGFFLRPVLAPASVPIAAGPVAPTVGTAQPTEAEATAAVRRFRAGFQTYTQATLTLGECSSGGAEPGVICMTTVTLRPGARRQNRTIGFARVNGQWEVSLLE